ncbi:tripartite tricarboxylate transporter substrate-binding protein [Roseateles sp. BYS78W]|uniref:Tripartite tricarboxylate transporter substrate-binding protein n=1 Tax=Pelomonas candidula TaxID=3299025 RepID=A0ABW7H8U8_9BURK
MQLTLAAVSAVGGTALARFQPDVAQPAVAQAAPGQPASPAGGSTPATAHTRLYLPFGAGGEADGSARNFIAAAARASAGLSFETVYLTAESGAVASRAVRAASADGGALLLGRVGSIAILPALSRHSAVPSSEFTALAVLDQSPLICAVRAGSAIQSMGQLQAAIAAAPGRLRYGTAGAGSLQNLAVRYLLSLSGLPGDAARPVHFSQGTQVTQALLDGEVDFSCNNARSIVPQVRSGALRGLMTTAQGRLRALPRLHNAAELGLRDMQQLQGWSALLGPPGMPPAVVARWRTLLDQVAQDAEWQAGTEALHAVPRIRAVPDPAQFLRQQAQFYERLVTLLGAQP